MTEQGFRHGRAGRPVAPRAPQAGWPGPGAFEPAGDDDADLPPWAGLGTPRPVRPRRSDSGRPRSAGHRPETGPPREPEPDAGRPGRGKRGRAAATRRRKSRRKLVIVAAAVAAVLAIAAVIYQVSRPSAKPSRYVQQLQAGEFRAVPDSCRAVTAATLNQYLPGQRTSFQPQAGSTTSECTFTVDRKPLFRVLDVTAQAYQPYLAVPGNGSATDNAVASYAQARQALLAPGGKAAAPPAVLAVIRHLGNAALSGLQTFKLGPAKTDIVTVLVRDRNALITVKLQAQVAGHGFGPASVTVLRDGALAAARELLAGLQHEPTVR